MRDASTCLLQIRNVKKHRSILLTNRFVEPFQRSSCERHFDSQDLDYLPQNAQNAQLSMTAANSY